MRMRILALAVAMGAVSAGGAAYANTCAADALAIEQDVRSGDSLTVHFREIASPSLGGALAPSQAGARVVGVGRIPINATLEDKVSAFEALEQAQIYGAIGEESACQVALHEALRHLNEY